MVVGRFKLDRLTLDEARTIATRIFEVIHGLVQHMKVIMKGEQTSSACHLVIVDFFFLSRRQSIDRPCPRCSEYVVSDDGESFALTKHPKCTAL
jgi:hypothetical protein